MKYLFLMIVFFVNIKLVFTQNIIQNGSFEECNPSKNCGGQPDAEGDFDLVDKWDDFGCYGGCQTSTPDWWCGPYPTCYPHNAGENGGYGIPAQSGTFYAGIFDNEGIYYYMGPQGFRTSIYKMSYWHRPSSFSPYTNPWGGSSVYLTTIAPTPLSCTNFAGGYKLKVFASSVESNSWVKNEFTFDALNGEITPFKYLTITGLRDGQCDRYMNIDNVEMEDLCCGNYILYQNFPLQPQYKLPELTRRRDYIKAGYNVGAQNHAQGNVVVRSNESVTFQAGNFISLEPGFIVQPGAVFNAKIESCDNFADNYGENPTLIYFSNTAWFDCTGTMQYNAGFVSTGASYYRVRMFDRWGALVLDKMGFINEIYTVYTDGSDISSIAQPNGLLTVVLDIFNCNSSHRETFSLLYEYTYGCSPMGKKENDTNSFNTVNNLISINSGENLISISPNPTKDQVVLSSNNNNLITHLVILNQQGMVVSRQELDFTFGDCVVDMKNLSSGVYYFKTVDNTQFKTNKVIKCE
jgi:hypothetical protein